MIVLGIESSCDETSVAVIVDDELKANLISSQDFHKNYGGVIPELSSRAHLQMIVPLFKNALSLAGIDKTQIDVVGATAGPGLIGSLLVGLNFAKGLSYALNKPFVPVNHLEGHIFSGFLMDEKPEFPYLCAVVSGGHSLLLNVKSFTEIEKLGTTIDDAAGEAFDKVAKLLGFGYPGGPLIQKAAEKGDETKIDFPVAQCKNEFDFSFSGLKTAVLRHVQKNYDDPRNIPENERNDVAASFQRAVANALTSKAKKVLRRQRFKALSVVGGVAANNYIRKSFEEIAEKENLKLVVPKLEYCGDNGAMIAFRAKTLHEAGRKYSLDYQAFPSMKKLNFNFE